jgi:tRNA A-37 threonylcarbamoyl transferase component Bud32
VRGVPTARPLALLERRRPLLRPRAAVFLEDLSGSPELDRRISKETGHPASLASLARGLGAFVGTLHRRGVYPHDLKACNILSGEEDFRLLDHDGMSFPARLGPGQVIRNLAQLNNSIPKSVSRTNRLRFLRTYAAQLSGKNRPDLKGLFRAVWERCRGRGILWVSHDGRDVHETW